MVIRRANTGRRVIVLLAGALILSGTTPGSVGSCSDGRAVADAQKFCLDSEALKCEREHAADRATDEEYEACLDEVVTLCDGFNWNPSICKSPPSEQRARACLSALASEERLGTATANLPECKASALCGDD